MLSKNMLHDTQRYRWFRMSSGRCQHSKARLSPSLSSPGVWRNFCMLCSSIARSSSTLQGSSNSAFSEFELPWSVEELLAMELQSIQKNAEALAGKGSSVKDLVLTIPPFYNAEERRAILLAADLAGLRVLELVTDGLAVGLNYATTRTFPSINEGGKAEHHMVFDMGAGSTKATILKFQGRTVKDVGRFNKTIQEVHVLGSGWDRTLGGDSFNALIVDDMVKKFTELPAAKSVSATVDSVKSHGRASAKLWKDAEKVRQILSANANTQAGFEGLYEDVDFRYKITRAEFEALAKDCVPRIAAAIDYALATAGLTIKDLDSVILNGGATRTPFVQKELERIVGDAEKIRTNVNSDEAAVFGAGFRGAVLSPSFRVKDIRAFESAVYPVAMTWSNPNHKEQNQKLFKATSYLGAEKQYTFKNHEDFQLVFFQDVATMKGGADPREVVSFSTTNLTETVTRLKDKFGCSDSDIHVKATTRLAVSNGEVEITKFVAECEVDKEKAGVVDSIKGAFGFGKKEQEPLSEEGEESTTSTVTEESTSTTTSSSSSSASADAKDSKDSKDAKSKPAPPTKRMEVIPIAFTTEKRGVPQLPDFEIKRMKDRMSLFEASDKARRLREEALNLLEGFTYKVREHLDNEDFIAASTEDERAKIETLRDAASDWIYSGGVHAPREELRAKYKEINELVAPVLKRKDEAAGRPAKIQDLEHGLKDTKGVIDSVTDQIAKEKAAIESWSSSKSAASLTSSSSTTTTTATESSSSSTGDFEGLEDEATATTTSSAPVETEIEVPPTIHFTAEELQPLQKLYTETSEWLVSVQAAQNKLAPHQEPSLLISDLDKKIKELSDARLEVVIKSLKINTPPKPKKSTTSKKSKPKTSKTKKAKGDKTASAAKGGKTLDFSKMKKVNGEITEEELKKFFQDAENDKYEDAPPMEDLEFSEPAPEAEAEAAKKKKKHDEL